MKFGTHLFPTQHSIQPGKFAQLTEERGFESVWFSEHTNIPVDYLRSEAGQTLPDYYWQTYDLFVACALAAAATETIQIGTGICLVIEHDPIHLAKKVASIDHISNGRFFFGVGAGWLAGEMENHGVHYPSRYRLLKEQIDSMKRIWAEAEAEFQGDFITFSRMKSYPKPIQSPYPPIIYGGGTGPKSLSFAAENCDGWFPILRNNDWDSIKKVIADLHQRAEAVGRDPNSIELSIFCWSLPEERIRDEMGELGVKRITVSFEAMEQEVALPELDSLAEKVMI